jgi:CRP/FNR family cyclic AMP-dependent transcriptional regulator
VLRKNAKLELLRRVPLFAGCSKRELGMIAALADELALPAGRALTKEGAPGREFVVIVDGANLLGGGDFLGELALVTERPRSATVTTTAPTRILLLTGRDFRTLMRDVPSIQAKVLAAVAQRLAGD